jgi:hypothetical protein
MSSNCISTVPLTYPKGIQKSDEHSGVMSREVEVGDRNRTPRMVVVECDFTGLSYARQVAAHFPAVLRRMA